jgi:hypothetical protein
MIADRWEVIGVGELGHAVAEMTYAWKNEFLVRRKEVRSILKVRIF